MTAEPHHADGIPLTFSCRRSGRCCTGAPGYVFLDPREAHAAAGHLGLPPDDFGRRHLRATPHGLSLCETTSGDCTLFDGEGCSIYDVRPQHCRDYPFWPARCSSLAVWRLQMEDCPGAGLEIGGHIRDTAWVNALGKAVESIYENVAIDIQRLGTTCRRCGKCCDFSQNTDVLFAASPEVLYFLLFGPGLPAGPITVETGLARGHTTPHDQWEPPFAPCPYQVGGDCTVRQHRPLGCRVFYCDPRHHPCASGIYETYHRQLRTLAQTMGIPWAYAPFLSFRGVPNP